MDLAAYHGFGVQGADEGIVKGLYKFSDAKPAEHKAGGVYGNITGLWVAPEFQWNPLDNVGQC